MSLTAAPPDDAWGAPISYLLVKLASRCNLACSYCYWFTDPDVYRRDAVMSDEVIDLLVLRVREQAVAHGLELFKILFHGGEPLLLKPRRFARLMAALAQVTEETGCRFRFSVTTNGLLIDEEWIDIFERYDVTVTVSIDGPAAIHDRRRPDLKGRDTHRQTEAVIRRLQKSKVRMGVLAVCDPQSPPALTVDYFVDGLGINDFNILIPDATHGSGPHSIGRYYRELFDYVYEGRAADKIRVTLLRHMIGGLLGRNVHTESIGVGNINTVTVLTDGELQALDVTRIAGDSFTKTQFNLRSHGLEDIKADPLWRELYLAGEQHHPTCQACTWYKACGGGHVSTRWKPETRYTNTSVYCDDFQDIFSHIWGKVSERLEITAGDAAS